MSSFEGKIAGIRRSLDLLEKRVMEFKSWCHEASLGSPPAQQPSEISTGEVETVEQLIGDLSREIAGHEVPNPSIWEPSRPFCRKIERNFGEYWAQQTEYFRCFLLWINKTRTYLEYLEGQSPHETPRSERPVCDTARLALVMKGGGIKGLAYVGALEILDKKYKFNWFIGTSAGAIAAILLAAGYTHDQLLAILRGKDFRDFFDAKWYQMPFNLLFHKGFHHSKSFTDWMDELLAKKLKSHRRVRLSDLPNRATVYASKRGTGALRFDSIDNDADAAYAARCSMSIPWVFVPQSDQGLRTYDGGIRYNYPVDKLLDDYPRTKFIGLYLGAEIYEPIKSTSVLADLISITSEASDDDAIDKYRDYTVIIDPRPIGTLDFALTEDEKEFLLATGRAGALVHLDGTSEECAAAVQNRDTLRRSVEDARSTAASKRRRWGWCILVTLLLIGGVATWRIWPTNTSATIDSKTGANAGQGKAAQERVSSTEELLSVVSDRARDLTTRANTLSRLVAANGIPDVAALEAIRDFFDMWPLSNSGLKTAETTIHDTCLKLKPSEANTSFVLTEFWNSWNRNKQLTSEWIAATKNGGTGAAIQDLKDRTLRQRFIAGQWQSVILERILRSSEDDWPALNDRRFLAANIPALAAIIRLDPAEFKLSQLQRLLESENRGIQLVGALACIQMAGLRDDIVGNFDIHDKSQQIVCAYLVPNSNDNQDCALGAVLLGSVDWDLEVAGHALHIVVDEGEAIRLTQVRGVPVDRDRGLFDRSNAAIKYLTTFSSRGGIWAPVLERQVVSFLEDVLAHEGQLNAQSIPTYAYRTRSCIEILGERNKADLKPGTTALSAETVTVVDKVFALDRRLGGALSLQDLQWSGSKARQEQLLQKAVWHFKTSRTKVQEGRVTVSLKVNGQELYRESGVERKCGTADGKFEDLGNRPDGQTFSADLSDKKIRLKAGDKVEMSVEHVGVGKEVHWGVSVGCSLLISGRDSAFSLGYSPDVFFENQRIRGSGDTVLTRSGMIP